jgi:hypothetical protein
MSTDALSDEQRRLEHRPVTREALRAEAVRLTALGFRPRDIGVALGVNDAVVLALLAGTP